ncbi:cyclic nucleotide-binding domain-containing protein [Azospirillum halopraeferens]|uniref:cyclic nucleotide-binding domain-containing protein n=1 Tax=Azospirillum halopraeferens TaxID=34010 RepID=UPI0005559422|nr:cyclic nucleotide-binding domain-containing protein [Azospirillum halopraeferens]
MESRSDGPAPRGVLDGIALFDRFSAEERDAVAARGRVVTVDPGTVLVREGEEGDALYVLLDGVVRILRRDPAGHAVEVARRHPGDCFGEIALIDGGPRSATVVAATPLRLFVLERTQFLDLVVPSPELLAKLMRELCRKLRDASDRLAREDLDGRMRAAEAELARHRSIVQAVTGLAHELNTPLGVCVTTASHIETLAEDGQGAAADFIEPARMLRSNLGRAVALVEAFTAIAAGPHTEPPETLDLVEAAEHAAALFAMDHPSARLTVAVTAPGDGPCRWRGARVHLERTLFELFANAAHHAYPAAGGAVEVSVVAAMLDGRPAWALAVRDHGPGIPAEARARLFDAFFTTARARGHKGLGLTIVYNTVTGPLGGRVTLDSRPGAGTAVTLTLPQAE